MKKVSVEQFIDYRSKIFKGVIKIIKTESKTIFIGDTIQEETTRETFIGKDDKRYNMIRVLTKGREGVCYGPFYKYMLESL